ncbi:MAG: TonB-dependent receptor [Bacteroidales bacterium]|nr:TonB-dependent receptor [Bacteroidales bacterium]
MDANRINQFTNDFKDLYYTDPFYESSDYQASEEISAGYFMTEINITKQLMFLGGARFEYTGTNYKGKYGTPKVDEDGNILAGTELKDTSGGNNYGEWLPMVHLRYKFTDWFDARIAYTKTLSRPNYFSLVPWIRVYDFNSEIEKGNSDLKHITADNLSLITSIYGNFGLFSIHGFYKEISNIDYTLEYQINDPGTRYHGYQVTEPVSSDYTSTVMGFEIDLQANLRFLPSPFNGLIFAGNYTFIQSETFFPYFYKVSDGEPPFFVPVFSDTVRSGPMPGQVDNTYNLIIGYEKKGFSARLSYVFKGLNLDISEEPELGSITPSVGKNEEVDHYTGNYSRWDLVLKQKFYKNKFSVFFNAQNLFNLQEFNYLGKSLREIGIEDTGMTFDIGVQYNF